MERTHFTYVTYISTTPERLWSALIDPKMTAQYWQHDNISEWRAGARWEHRPSGGAEPALLVGKVLEIEPPRRLVLTWALPAEANKDEQHSRVTFEIEPYRGVVRLTLMHDRLQLDSEMERGIVDGWPKVLSSLKSLLEVGRALPQLW